MESMTTGERRRLRTSSVESSGERDYKAFTGTVREDGINGTLYCQGAERTAMSAAVGTWSKTALESGTQQTLVLQQQEAWEHQDWKSHRATRGHISAKDESEGVTGQEAILIIQTYKAKDSSKSQEWSRASRTRTGACEKTPRKQESLKTQNCFWNLFSCSSKV